MISPSTIQIVEVGDPQGAGERDVRLKLTRPIIKNKCSIVKEK
jgi:hypothetical protein